VLNAAIRQRASRQFLRASIAGLTAVGLASTGLGAAASPASAASPAVTRPPAPLTRAASAPAGAPGKIRVGRVTLIKCGTGPLTYCGSISVPLDYYSKASPDIHIGFVWLPATDARQRKGTVLAVEGGPGYSSTGTEPEYAAMLGSLRKTRNLLLVNLRGTGNSTPLNCPGLEKYGQVQAQYGPAFDRLVAACGNQLNHTWKYRRGGWVHASDLFNTAYSAKDVARVLTDLDVGKVDLYGDSYGSWFAQVFASRYANRLRSVTLDSTYQVLGLDPWYTTTVITARQAFEQACARSAACQRAAGGQGAWRRIGELDRRLEHKPITGKTASLSGGLVKETVTAETLVNLVNNAGFDPLVYRDLDAAARALLDDHDQAPLLRLAEASLSFDDTNYPLPEFSDALYFAVSCTDYVQLFSRTASPAVRAHQYARALAGEPAGTFAPFTVSQWTDLDQYTETYSGCLDWPAPTRLTPPITRQPPLVPASLPVLILSGTFDSLTPWLHGASLVASQVGKSARLVRFANLTHVMLQDADDTCAASILQRFIADPGGLKRENTSCAAKVAPIHTVGSYPLRLAQAAPATATKGNTASRTSLQAASTALACVGDEISRYYYLDSRSDPALRGGEVGFNGGNLLTISLVNARWVANATINGTARWNQRTGWVTAKLTVDIAGGTTVRFTASWRAFGAQAQLAVITGSAGGQHLAAVAPPP
jgi:pimeloyl-ACP methyl ester carboxylesterase